MSEFLKYFLGEGNEVEFSLFGISHFAPIVVMIAIILLIAKFADKIRNSKCDKAFRYILAFALICSEMSYYWRLVAVPSLGANPAANLPISVCGWAVIFCSFMIVGKTQSLFDISYFWLLAGSIFALITPTVLTYAGPTRFRYYQFWSEHTLGYIAIFYMIFVHKMRPTVKSAIRSYIALVVLAVIAYFSNVIIGDGANYLFLARPEAAPSVLDILPPNFALRTLIMAAVITTLFFVAYLPWLIKDIKSKKLQKENQVKQEVLV